MDKDIVILKHEQEKTKDVEIGVETLNKSSNKHEEELKEIQSRINTLYEKVGKNIPKINNKSKVLDKEQECLPVNNDVEELTYDKIYDIAEQSLKERGLDVDSIDFDDVISDNELNEILSELNESLPKEQKWKKSDFIMVFVTSIIGSILDVFFGNRKTIKKLADKTNKIHEELDHRKNPLDFQGKIKKYNFGGGNHRIKSKAHDILRPFEGIKMYKEGLFKAANGVVSSTTKYGTPFEQLTLISAIVKYSTHMLADLFSEMSLPIPGYSFLVEAGSTSNNSIAVRMYVQGFNCKNILIQSITAISNEVLIRLYFALQTYKNSKEIPNVEEDFSNWELLKKSIKPVNNNKLNEMLLVTHTIVLAFNVGKIVITKEIDSQNLNLSEIVAVVKYGIKVSKSVAKRNSEYAKLIYHASEINKEWFNIEKNICNFDENLISEMKEQLIIS